MTSLVPRNGRLLRRRRHPEIDVVFHVPSVTSLLTGAAFPPAGGAETQAYLVARELARQGVRVALICYGTAGQIAGEIDGIRVIVRPPSQGNRRFIGFLLEVLIILRVTVAVDALVYVQRVASFHTGVVAAAAKLRRRRFVYSSAAAHDFDFDLPLLKRARDRWLYRWAITSADDVVAQTEEQVALCRADLGRNPVLIRSIAEPARPRGPELRAFLWVGRADSVKRPLEFVSLARTVPEARFRMVLSPSERWADATAEVERAARSVPNLEVLGGLARADLGSLMEEAVAIVNTSESEGMPNVLLEGWARGVPALVLHHDPDGVIERHSLGGFAHGSLDCLADDARSMWWSRHQQRDIDERCRGYATERHSAAAVGEQWLRLLGRD